jgi:twitching motility protein PilT
VALVDSLLTAIVRADGDALVLHTGERPYVVAPSGQSEIASRVLTLEAMTGMLGELLPAEARHALDDCGAVQHDLAAAAVSEDERFTLVAARGGDDIWIEIRRHRKALEPPAMAAVPAVPEAPVVSEVPVMDEPDVEPDIHEMPEIHNEMPEIHEIPEINYEINLDAELELEPSPMVEPPDVQASEPGPRRTPEPHTAVVLPIARNQVRNEQTVRFTQPLRTAGIDRLLRIAAARGASTLYLTSQARPSIRIDGEISAIEGEPVLSEPDVEALMLDIIPERNRETLRSEAGTEWICDVPEVGRIRCVTFRDHRGAGGIFRMIPARAISAEQLGLSREIQGLCAEAEGLLLITGPRSSGKSTLISAFVDLINRTRSDHVITLENQIKFVHESRLSLVSQREVRGDNQELMSAARAALRENPDVLVVEDLRSPEVVTLALEAAQSGHLVIGALTAHTAPDAVDRIIDQTPPERRPKIQLGLAEALRGVVAQVLLRKTMGGRVAAREVLLNTSAVANLIAEGKTSQLSMAIDSGRKHGMVALNDALAAFVQSGVVESREAYRQASDQQGFLGLLKRQGIDTSFVERLA